MTDAEIAYATEAPWDAEYEPLERATPSRGPWFGMSQDAAFAMAQCAALATDTRLLGYAVARADRFGHSEYGPGELERLLGVNAQSVRKAIVKLKAAGVLAPDADARCLLMAYEFRGGGKAPKDPKRCSRHGAMGAATRERPRVPNLPKQRDAALFTIDPHRT
ncbi:hypothetical protein AB0942_21690 [Streptomyces nodosus]|uniref:hypothetical protein n=1 Tax=Streptomyces nodosus TaxID=40318 RepID=UPI00345370C0